MREIIEYELDNIDEVLAYIDNTEKMENINSKRIKKLNKIKKNDMKDLINKLSKYHHKLPDNIANIVREYCFKYGREIFIQDLFEPDYYSCTYYIKKYQLTVYFNKDGYIIFEI